MMIIVIAGDILGRMHESWAIDYISFNSGTNIIPTATVRLRKGEEIFQQAWGQGWP